MGEEKVHKNLTSWINSPNKTKKIQNSLDKQFGKQPDAFGGAWRRDGGYVPPITEKRKPK